MAPFKEGDVVRITCRASKYHGIEGMVFEIEERSRYAMIDMPAGTAFRAEGITTNRIVEEMRRSAKTRKTQFERWPTGDPQWFPWEWLFVK